MNSVCITGRLGREPEMKTVNGAALCKLCVAVDAGKDKTAWVDVDVWDKTAENCGTYLAKGREVAITGSLDVDEWTDRETGKKRSRMKVRAFRVDFIGGRQEKQDDAQPVEAVVEDSGDVPF